MVKVAFFFAGTGMPATNIKGAYDNQTFYNNVIRVYFNGCQDKKIGGRSTLLGYLNPDLDVVGDSLLSAFSKKQGGTLNLSTLKKLFGNSIIIEPEGVLNQKVDVTVEDITLLGFSRGAVTTFAAARKLDSLDIPLSLLAVEPVPGEDLKQALGKNSIHRKNNDLSSCKNITHADIFLGTYSKHNSPFENKWFRQMAPQLPPNKDCHIYSIPKKSHFEQETKISNHIKIFLHKHKLTKRANLDGTSGGRLHPIPKVAQQKFHQGVVGRVEHLPSYQKYVFNELSRNVQSRVLRPIPFKSIQALVSIHKSQLIDGIKNGLEENLLASSETIKKSKGLREFIVEFDAIVRFTMELAVNNEAGCKNLMDLYKKTYPLILDFYRDENPSFTKNEDFAKSIQKEIHALKDKLPKKIHQKLEHWTALLLKENPLMHPHLLDFIDEREMYETSNQAAHRPILDGEVTNAQQLATKLFHSSQRQRILVFNEHQGNLDSLLQGASDLTNIASFLTPSQLKKTLTPECISKFTSMPDLLYLMSVLPTKKHQDVVFRAFEGRLLHMHPTKEQFDEFKAYPSINDFIPKSLILSFLDRNSSRKNEQGITSHQNLQKQLSKLIDYVRDLHMEIKKESKASKFLASSGLIANKTKKLEEALQAIDMLNQILSNKSVSCVLKKVDFDLLQQLNSKANGIFSVKGRYHSIIEDLKGMGSNDGSSNTNDNNKSMPK